MLGVLLCWLLASFVFVSFGDAFLRIYNKVCRRNESYNPTDIFLFGMFVSCGFVSVWSLWMPSNQIILSILILLAVAYQAFNKKRLAESIYSAKRYVRSLGKLQILLFCVAFVSFLLYCTWTVIRHDPSMYHFQMVRWNEEYPVIPGLANIEERFGFNSNYFLLSAVFSFRFLLGEPLYSLQGLLGLYIAFWIIKQVIANDYSLKSVLLSAFYVVFIYINTVNLRVTSSDIIPNLVVFYLFAKLITDTSQIKKSFLLYLFVPVALATFKLSAGGFFLIALLPVYLLIKSGTYKPLLFVAAASIFVIVPWLTRNVIMSGWLIFPLHVIDLFSVDWKVPSAFLQMESEYINKNSRLIFWELVNGSPKNEALRYHIIRYLHIATYGLLIVSPLLVALSVFIKRKTNDKLLYYIYAILTINIVIWWISAADPRFVNGALLITVFLVCILLLPDLKLKISGFNVLSVLPFIMIFYLFFDNVKWIKVSPVGKQSLVSSIIKPVYDSDQKREKGKPVYSAYELNNEVIIYVTDDSAGKCYDIIPCVKILDMAEFNFQDYKNLEARGTSIKHGFRYKLPEGYKYKPLYDE